MRQDALRDAGLLKAQCCIAGEWVDADDGSTALVRDPASGEAFALVPRAGAAETRRAVAAAELAFAAWSGRTASERARVLRRWHDLIQAHRADLASILTWEQGKPMQEAEAEIDYAASYVEWFAEEAKRLYGEVLPSPWGDRRLVVTREPIGVCAAITPWNFPAAMVTRKVAPALAAGCTIVLKPAPQTPLTALALAELALRAGVPGGVFNVVTGDAQSIGQVLTSSAAVRKLSFTGSTPVGRLLAIQCAPTLKRLSLELGGNAPFIVFEDADLDAAVAGAMASKFRNSGQTCVCANRLLVHSAVYEAFAARLAQAAAHLHVAPATDAAARQGPLIEEAAVQKIEALVSDALAQGARVVTGGSRHPRGGTFFEPTVVADVAAGARLAREEIFGPVAPLFRFEDEAQAIRMANDSEAGLAAYVFSRDLGRAWRVASALQVGMVGVNTGTISTAVAPFGGVKQSGMGREGSRHGLEDYTSLKYVCIADG